jgi:dipeptidase
MNTNSIRASRIGFTRVFAVCVLSFGLTAAAGSQTFPTDDWVGGYPDGCTSITVGRNASSDGSVITSHTCDSHRTRTWLDIAGPKDYNAGSHAAMVKRMANDSTAMPSYRYQPVGEIPQVKHTYGYINTAYPCMNEHQLAIGESTFGGRAECRSDRGLIDCQQLVRLMMERCRTAREAIRMAGELTKKYGYNDGGECLTIADTREVWHFEIVGPGKDRVGAVWVAQRVPDGHVSVNANGSRIRGIDLKNTDMFMASENVFRIAEERGWWNPDGGDFEFCYAYAPGSRTSIAARRREWRVLDLVAPSLKLHPESENYPFSVKPDTLVTLQKLVTIFQDYYENTPYNFVKNITAVDDSGRTVLSPLANPFMPYDMNKIFNINGGWDWRGERTIARWYTMYATITQSRDWLPDEIGGVVWLALDNVATSIYIPVYSCVTDLPDPYKTPGRVNGYNRDCAWWAFNRLGTLAAQRWGDMRYDVESVWKTLQREMFDNQAQVEKEALSSFRESRDQAVKYLTDYTNLWGKTVVERCWKLGDFLWTKYDEKF